MAKKEKIICVGCPMGCEVELTLDDKNEIVEIDGYKCKEGKGYAVEEYKNPVRVLAATVLTEGSQRPLLSVRTTKPILKSMLLRSMGIVAKARVKPPVKAGEAVIPNLLNTGIDLIATADLLS